MMASEAFARAISRLFGWVYFLSWSLSFYPQPLLNWRRKSTTGFTIDFPTLNILGFAAYSTSTALFLWNPTVRRQYASRNPLAPEPTVRFNDFVFAFHGLLLCFVAYSQFYPRLWGFKEGSPQRASRTVVGIVWGCIIGVSAVTLVVLSKGKDDLGGWAWIEVVYAISYVKLIATVVKYMPQVRMNYLRQSTVGFSIEGFMLDLAGGILSIGQLLIDASLQADWSGVTGNPAKLGLANISIVFDVIFLVQHYILYRNNTSIPSDERDDGEGERDLLIGRV